MGCSACIVLGVIFAVVTFLNEWTGKAQNNILLQVFVGIITVFDVLFVFCAGLMTLAVVRMWKSLETQKQFRRNSKVVYVHLGALCAFILLYFVSIVFLLTQEVSQ